MLCKSLKKRNPAICGRKHKPYKGSSNSARPKKEIQVKTKFKSMLIISFDIIDITKNLSSQAKQSILNTTVTFYGDCVKMCEDFAPNIGDKTIGCCITTKHHTSFFTKNFLPKKQHVCCPSSTLLFSFPTEDKT
jgi:hypothetical protein